MLAPQTTLSTSSTFGVTDRTVTLRGEAHFNVARVGGRPFLVRTGNIVTRVLGTTFDIMHYPGDRDVRVVVVSGKVAITTVRRAAIALASGTVGHITDSTAEIAPTSDVSNLTSWTRDALIFEHTPVRYVLTMLGHWYGYEFKLRDSTLANHYVTAQFDGESVMTVLRSISAMLNVSMTFDGHVVTLTPRRLGPSSIPSQHNLHQSMSTQSEVGR